MPEFADKTKQEAQLIQSAAADTSSKRAVGKGQTYAEGQAQVSPAASNDVTGPIGRVFNRILGLSDDAKGTADKVINRNQVKNYLDKNLQLAKDEWFRGAKLDGVADKLMETLDKDGNGKVGWLEFQAFNADVLSSIAPGTKPGDSPEAVSRAATQQFASMDKKGKKGSLNYDELESGTKASLPKGTEHADLISQLGARIALDAVDTDQRSTSIKDRDLSQNEWLTAAQQMAK